MADIVNYGQQVGIPGQLLQNANTGMVQAETQNVPLAGELTKAQTALTGAQASGQDISNQLAGTRLGLLQQALTAPNNAGPGGTSSSDVTAGGDAGTMASAIDAKFGAQAQMMTPQEAALYQRSQIVAQTDPGVAASMMVPYQQRIAGLKAAANHAFMNDYSISQAPDGTALDTYKRVDPKAADAALMHYGASLSPGVQAQLAAAIKDGRADNTIQPALDVLAANGITKDKIDADVKQHATDLVPILHPYTGRETDKLNNQTVDKQFPNVKLGDASISQGDIAKMRQEFEKQAVATVTTTQNNRETQVQQYKLDGYPTPSAWAQAKIDKTLSAATNKNSTVATQPAVAQATAGMPVARAPVAAAPASAVAAPAPAVTPPAAGGGAPAGPPTRPGQGVSGRTLVSSANVAGGKLDLTDAPPEPALPKLASNQRYNEADMKPATEYAAKKQDTNQAMGQANQTAQLNLQKDTASLNTLPTAAVGPGSEYSSRAQAWMQQLSSNPQLLEQTMGSPASREVLTKLLGQQALSEIENQAAGKGGFRMSTQAAALAMNKLNASPDLMKETNQFLLNHSIAQDKYDVQRTGPDYLAYSAAGKDVTAYDTWYGKQAPLPTFGLPAGTRRANAAATVAPGTRIPAPETPSEPTIMGPNGHRMVVRGGAWVDAGSTL